MPLRDFMKQIVRAPARDQLREHLGGLVQRRGPDAELLVEQRRIPHRDAPARLRRPVPVDELEAGQAGRALGELDRIGDRRARQQEARLAAVDRGDASQPPEHVGDVRAEHAAVDVRLVDDHERQVREQLAPGRVVGQDPDVEHVGVGEDQVRALADRRPLGSRGVAVVDRRPDLLVQAEGVQRPRLVLGQRLGRVEVERSRGAVAT